MKYKEDIYLENNNDKIYGEKLPVILYVNNQYTLANIAVFKNGLIQTFWGLLNFEQTKDKINEGKLRQSVPNNVKVEVEELCTILNGQFIPDKSNEDFIKEIEDLINEFNNRDTRRSICEAAYKIFLIAPTNSNLDNLTEKYNDLPTHQNVIFEYIDVKDPLCRFMKDGRNYSFENRKELLQYYFKFELKKPNQ